MKVSKGTGARNHQSDVLRLIHILAVISALRNKRIEDERRLRERKSVNVLEFAEV